MARLYDGSGNLLGGLAAAHGPQATFLAVAEVHRTRLNPRFGAEETVPGLTCSYGSLAYSYVRGAYDGAYAQSHLSGCHNPVEDPDERHHCDLCGGDYCSIHAEAAAHDCTNVILPT